MSSHITDVEGDWKIVDYPHHPECVGCVIEIKGQSLNPNMFTLKIQVVNHLSCNLKHNSGTDQWETSDFFTTELHGTPEEIYKELVFKNLMSKIRKLDIHGEEHLMITTDDHQQIRLEHLP